MGIINSNLSACGLVEKYVGTAYDHVHNVSANMDDIITVAGITDDGRLDEVIDLGDDITIAAALIDYKGLWDAGTTYLLGESVSHDDLLWISNTTNLNSEPSLANADWKNIVSVNVGSVETADKLPDSESMLDSIIVEGLFIAADGGGGLWNWEPSQDKADANLGLIIDPTVAISLAAQGTGVGVGCWVRAVTSNINIKWFGAIGDGLSDDTEVIQKTILAALGGIVIFPTGTYRITDTIDCTASLLGTGGTLLQAMTVPHYQEPMIKLTADKLTVRGLFFQGNNTVSGGIALAADNCSVTNNHFSHFGDAVDSHGVAVGSVTTFVINDSLVNGNFFENSVGITNADISFSYRARGVIINNNVCLGDNDAGISLNSVLAGGDCVVTNNIIRDKVRHGIIGSYNTNDEGRSQSIISNNYVSNTGWTGIYCTGGTELAAHGKMVINGNMLEACGGNEVSGIQGAIFVNGFGGHLISNNLILDSCRNVDGSQKPYAGAGIKIYPMTEGAIVSNNIIRNAFGSGIEINSLGTEGDPGIKEVIVEGNLVNGFTFSGIDLMTGISNGLNDILVSGNLIQSDDPGVIQGIRVWPHTNGTVDNIIINGNILLGERVGGGSNGIYIHFPSATKHIGIKNNSIKGFDTGFRNFDYTEDRVIGENIIFADNMISDCVTGIAIGASSTRWAFIENAKFEDCTYDFGSDNPYICSAHTISKGVIHFSSTADPALSGTWVVGDMWQDPTPNAGGFVGKVCITAGSSGAAVWKNFGAIEA